MAQAAAQLKSESHFEVHVLSRGRWMIECISREQAVALEDANELVRRPDVRGVKVIKETYSPFNDLTAAISIFSHVKPAPKRRLMNRARGPVTAPKTNNAQPSNVSQRRAESSTRTLPSQAGFAGIQAFGIVSIILALCTAGLYLMGIIVG